MSFIESVKATLNEDFNESVTENGAIGYRTTGVNLLDINFAISSMRNMSDDIIVEKFIKAFFEDKMAAIKWLFYVSDVREGVGERRLFRVCLSYLGKEHPNIAKAVLELVPFYSRWDNLFCLLDTELTDQVCNIIKNQMKEDTDKMDRGEPISLLAKWMPSINSGSAESRKMARTLCNKFNIRYAQYRKSLSALRRYLNVTEVYMCANEWGNIDYSAVPSRANLIYNNAFLKHDEERRRAFLDALQRGETKINSSVLYPHDIVHSYTEGGRRPVEDYDIAYEELWKALPDYVNSNNNTIVIRDGSGSMINNKAGKTKITALDVAAALAIYFSERSSGEFKDSFITFSEHPRFVDLSRANSLREKIEITAAYTEVANTNIEAVFDLILQTAINCNMKQEDLPQNILIISDMEFDSCATQNRTNPVRAGYYMGEGPVERPTTKLFKIFEEKYANYGYKLPRLVFWNIIGSTGTIPVKENDLGVALVSGFSPVAIRMVLSNKTDPYECLLDEINSDRYKPVEEAVGSLI